MKRILPFFALLLISLTSASFAQSATQPASTAADESEIRAAIKAQTEAWNHADIPAFMRAYEDSPDTTFIGATLGKGYQPIRERYLRNYTTPEQMGKLTFNDLDIRLLPSGCGKSEIALVTGKFHLDRTRARRSQKRRRHLLSGLAQRPPRLEDHPRPHQLSALTLTLQRIFSSAVRSSRMI
jgi:ketosteroid isomerase-like protein